MSIRLALLFSLALWAPTVALAQQDDDYPPFAPPNEELDQELDDSLRQEFEGPMPAPQQTAPPPQYNPVPDYAAAEEESDDDEFRLVLGGMVAHFYSRMQDVDLSYREGTQGGQKISLDDALFEPDGYDDYDGDAWENSQIYRGWFDIGKHVSLVGSFWRTVHRNEAPAIQDFTFGSTTYLSGQQVETKLDLGVADFDVVFKPINNRFVSLDLHFGGRYIYWRTTLQRTDTATFNEATRTIEAAIPMVGLGITLRPLKQLQFYARGRVGHLSYEQDERYVRRNNGDIDHIKYKERESTSLELDAGILVILADTIGFQVGYRADYLKVEREVLERSVKYEGISHGAYGGVVLQF